MTCLILPIDPPPKAKPKCSFCGKEENKVGALIAGLRAHICNECLAKANKIVKEYDNAHVPL